MKVLCIRLSSIGDIILCSPIFRVLKNQLHAEVHFLTKSKFEFVQRNNPHIDEIKLYEDNFKSLVKELRHENYDLLIDLHKNLRTSKIKVNLRIKTYSFDKINFEKWIMVNFKINRLPEEHLVDRYFQGLKSLGIKDDGKGLEYFYHQDTELPGELLNLNPYLALSIGGSFATKRLPKERLVELCDMLSKNNIVIIGGKEDAATAQYIQQNSRHESLINLCGRTNFDTTAKIIEKAQYVISHDTATLHLAAAYNKALISIWGNTIPEFGMFPYRNQNEENSLILENKGLSCRPCSKIGFDKCPKGHFRCMQDLDLRLIKELIE